MENIIRLPGRAHETAGANASQVRKWPVAVFAADAKGWFIYVNARWAHLSGLAQSAAMGSGWVHSIHDSDREEVIRQWQEAVNGEQAFGCSYRLKGALVDRQWVLSQATPQYDENGELTGFGGTLVSFPYQSPMKANDEGGV